MSPAVESFLIGGGALLLSTVVAAVQVRHARRRESVRARLIREAHFRAVRAAATDPTVLARASSAEWLPADVEDHLLRFLAEHPEVAAGITRIRQATDDDHTTKGETP